jgi:hypothetical protein
MNQLSHENDRVRRNTDREVQAEIDAKIEANIQSYRAFTPTQIEHRITELEQEWSMERYLETNAASFSLASLLLGVVVSRKWLLLTATISAFLLQHALQGWCPPVPVFRRLGVRTRGEIDREIHALKALRGDYQHLQPPSHASNPFQPSPTPAP